MSLGTRRHFAEIPLQCSSLAFVGCAVGHVYGLAPGCLLMGLERRVWNTGPFSCVLHGEETNRNICLEVPLSWVFLERDVSQ
jgi:hypothetical protein